MGAGDVMVGGARGLGAGLVAGAAWWSVETTFNWALGGVVPGRVLAELAVLDLVLGAVAGAVIGGLLRRREAGALALGLAVAFGLLRVYAPPGVGSEALFLGTGVAAAVLAHRLAGADRGRPLGFLHLLLLTTVAVTLGEFALEERYGQPVASPGSLVVFALLPLAAVGADRVVALLVRRRGWRFGLECVAAGLALVVWSRPLAGTPLDDPLVTAVPPAGARPDVILVSLDTTRADHLSTYGYTRDTSPQLTALAADGLNFTQARSPAAWTLPGHASLFTGTYPSRHGARLAGAWLPGQSIDGRRRVAFPLGAEAVTLAECLRDDGYRTAAFVANFSYLYRDFGLAQGFGHYDDAPGLLLRHTPHAVQFGRRFAPGFHLKPFRSAREINARALEWLDRAPPGRPVFLFLNYMEPHQPWLAPPPYDRWSRGLPEAARLARTNLYTHAPRDLGEAERAFVVANYDGQIAAMDAALGELMAALRARGRYEGALIVVTSDHGEFLGEHGQMGHIGRMLYEPVLRVPLVVKLPGRERRRGVVATPVQLVDVLPAVLEVTGTKVPPGVQGQPLLAVTHPVLAEEDINPFLVWRYGETYDRGIRVVYDGSHKLISTSRGREMLFDLARDPGERDDLAAREPERAAALRRRLEAAFGRTQVTASAGSEASSGTN
jgi:arylsulfatase A-like enzyme